MSTQRIAPFVSAIQALNPVGFWQRQETTGTTAIDSSASENNGTDHGGVTLNQAGASGMGVAATYNGSTGYTSIAGQATYAFERTEPFSILTLVNPNITRSGGDAGHAMFSKLDSNSPNSGYEFSLEWNGAKTWMHAFIINNFGGNNLISVTGFADIINATYYFLAMTYDGSSEAAGVKLYVNGAADTASIVNDSLSGSIVNSITPCIGCRNAAAEFLMR
jgi:hypothetical protein